MSRPDLSRVPAFFHHYIEQAPGDDLSDVLQEQTRDMNTIFGQIPPEKQGFRYGADKWSIREVIQHIIDAERVFAYRALCIARKDPTPLPSFDENLYAETSRADERNWEDLLEEFRMVRRSSELLFGSFNHEQLESEGMASGKSIYVLGIGFVVAGHAAHHVNILRERYLQ